MTREAVKLLWTPSEAAEKVGFSASTLRRWCQAGTIEAVRHGSRVLIPLKELERLAGGSLSAPAGRDVESRARRDERDKRVRKLLAEILTLLAED